MKDFERIVLPIIAIMMITGLCCYYIFNEYRLQQREQARAASEEIMSEEELISEEELKYETIAMLIAKNSSESKLTFKALDSDKEAAYTYDGRTNFMGKRGSSISVDQLELGEIVDVSYSVRSGTLDKVQISDKVWTQDGVTRFAIDEKNKTMKIGNTLYMLNDDLIVSYGERLAKLIDVTNVDTLTVKGQDKKVYSIIVGKGHGYLRLINDSYFLGGWLEVGQDIIKPITESMLLPVPEGPYHIRVTNRGYVGDDDVKIERDKECIVDLSNIDIQEVAIGHIQFNIKPDFAQLFIDNEMTDYEDRVALEYGVHKVHVELAGYSSVDTNIKVAQEYADVNIELDKDSGAVSTTDKGSASSTAFAGSSDNTSSASSTGFNSSDMTNFRYTNTNPTSSSSTAVTSSALTSASTSILTPTLTPTPTPTLTPTPMPASSSSSIPTPSNRLETSSSTAWSLTSPDMNFPFPFYDQVVGESARIYVDQPQGATVYIDGMYIGVAPAACDNITGPHIVTLMDAEHGIKSFSINVENGSQDVSYSFSFE